MFTGNQKFCWCRQVSHW